MLDWTDIMNNPLRDGVRRQRPTDVVNLGGDAGKALAELDWQPVVSPRKVCAEMVQSDPVLARRKVPVAAQERMQQS